MINEFEYRLRTIIGFLIIIVGLAFGLWFAWWLNFRGNVIDILHAVKMSLPGWAWVLMRYSFSIAFGASVMALCIAVAMLVLSGGRKSHL
jgi:hypothetical protein